MNILFTLNKRYLTHLIVLLASLFRTNPTNYFSIYIMTKDIEDDDLKVIYIKLANKNYHIHLIKFDDSRLQGARTSKRYPLEIYYRIFAAKVLPNSIDKILYLDPDIVIIDNIDSLYNEDFNNNFFVGATHVRKFLRKFNEIRLQAKKNVPYVNTGVLLMNIKLLRELNYDLIYDYIRKSKYQLMLPDQDVIFKLFGDRVKIIDHMIYNLSDRSLYVYNLFKKEKIDMDWVKKNTVIIHYIGRNKPWKKRYFGKLNIFYNQIAESLNQ